MGCDLRDAVVWCHDCCVRGKGLLENGPRKELRDISLPNEETYLEHAEAISAALFRDMINVLKLDKTGVFRDGSDCKQKPSPLFDMTNCVPWHVQCIQCQD
jgi:hypothetical protein